MTARTFANILFMISVMFLGFTVGTKYEEQEIVKTTKHYEQEVQKLGTWLSKSIQELRHQEQLNINIRTQYNMCQEDLVVILREIENDRVYFQITEALKIRETNRN